MYIKTISNSKASTYDECHYKYGLRYGDHLPEPKGSDKSAMNFGSYIHKVLEEGVNASSVEEMLLIAEEVRPSYSISEKYKGKDLVCIKNFLKFNATLSETVGVELVYDIPLTLNDKGEPDISQNGIIDRVVKGKEGGLLVIDYKTGKREKSKVELYQDPQLKGYAHGVHKLYGVPYDNIVCGHYYPMTNNFVFVQYSGIQINSYVRSMINKVWQIRKKKRADCRPMRNEFCNYCAYKVVCPEFNNPIAIEHEMKKLKELKKVKDKEYKLLKEQAKASRK